MKGFLRAPGWSYMWIAWGVFWLVIGDHGTFDVTLWAVVIGMHVGLLFFRRRNPLRWSAPVTHERWRPYDATGRDRRDHHDPGADEDPGHDAGARSLFATRASTRVEPIQGWKRGKLSADGKIRSGVYNWPTTGDWMTAECRRFIDADNLDEKHVAPVVDCTCGFYACTEPLHNRLDHASSDVLFEVELAGTILSDAAGVMRASHQRVMTAYVSRVCSICRVALTELMARPGAIQGGEESWQWMAICGRCIWIVRRSRDAESMTFADLTGLFGVEVKVMPWEGWAKE